MDDLKIATEYLVEINTILGLAEVRFPETSWHEPAETSVKYWTDGAQLALSQFVSGYGIGVNGVRFDIELCSPLDLVRSLEVNDSYHHSPYISSWNIVYGYIPGEPEEPITESLADAAREATGHESATKAQKDAGNYKKGRCRLCGFDVLIEQPAGSYREGVDPDGTPWKTRMNHHYGALLKTSGADGDHVDAFFNPDVPEDDFGNMPIFVVDQVDKDGSFDEHKALFGFSSKAEAKTAYLSNYGDDWQGLGDIHQMDLDTFKEWVQNKAKTKKAVNPVFEAVPADWREQIMKAGSFEELEVQLKSVFNIAEQGEKVNEDNITIQNVAPADSNLTDGQEITTWATNSKIVQYQKDAERLSKKAEKLGIQDFITIKKTGNVRNAYWVRTLVDVKRDGEHIYVERLIPDTNPLPANSEVTGMTKQYEVTVTGKPLKIEGWFVAGKAEHMQDEQGNYHALVRGYNIRKADVKSCGPMCEHCGYNRRRKSTFILKNEQGEVKQVGSTCVDDFTGRDGADSIADLMGSSWKVFTIGDEDGDGESYGNERITAFPVRMYLAHVAMVMDADGGFFPASSEASTAYNALRALDEAEQLKEKHLQKADEVIAWAKAIENPDSSYMDNIKTISQLEYFPKTLLGVAGSMVNAYNREVGKNAAGTTELNEHFGNVGEKVSDIKAKIVSVKPIDGYYGTTYLYVFKADSGHTFKWFSSRDVGGEIGDYVSVSGKIKAHDEYNGKKQTNLTRASFDVLSEKDVAEFTQPDNIE